MSAPSFSNQGVDQSTGLSPGGTAWQPTQLYFLTTHQPSWNAFCWPAGRYMKDGGIPDSTLPIRKVLTSRMSSGVEPEVGHPRAPA